MDIKKERQGELKSALKALKLKRDDLLAWKEYGDRLVLVTGHGQKLIWRRGRD